MVSTQVHISGYQVSEELYNGSRTLVYRGYRESDSLPVVIKLLKNAYPSFNELVQFRNQYTITKNINYPGIIQTYSLEAYHNAYALVMEDFGGIPLKYYFKNLEILNKTCFIIESLSIAISLCDILETLYQQRVIHKDIKPANILINPETKQVKLIDFSIASLLNKETQAIKNPNILEGTLAYISPEQTGRMNRGIDYRSDFYSLGVTFYELLTGKLPFISDDAMELVHCHIAKQPPELPHPNPLFFKERAQEIPQVLNDIVMKLMAKNAEDRYQSALGLKHDLETCLSQIKETGKIESFEIARKDICDRFIIPDKLYGRDKEVEQLLTAFERVSSGNSEMMLVAGFSGIGKTAVVNEVHKPIVKQRGYFIKGKFDQFNRNIPLSAFVQAFRDLMKQLISESDTQIAQWKSKILAALGDNGQVLIEVIPELECIIGNQPSVTELSGNAAQNRFNLLFHKFIQVFTTKEHPLVIFLDDLQWADSASLNLLKLLMSEASSRYLLVLGAYRDNEVFIAHPMMLMLDEIEKGKSIINTITLPPLPENTVNILVAETLSCTLQLAQPLTQLVYQKTKGNPFFITQFLKALYEEGWITFQLELGYWQCNISSVRQLALTDDVVEFMALQLQKLPIQTQEILKLAACIGNQFDLNTLAVVSEQSSVDTATYLWKALQEGLVIPINETYKFFQSHNADNQHLSGEIAVVYKFLHDRIQQAAYSLISADKKQSTHLKIARLLLDNIPETEREDKIFEIVSQFNIAVELISQPTERYTLALLNSMAGRKAKAANAYVASLEYLTVGINLLSLDSWVKYYDLTLELYESAAEAAYLSNNFAAMDSAIDVVLQRAKTLSDTVKVYDVKIQGYGAQNELGKAIDTALAILKTLGIAFPETIESSDLQQALADTKALWDGTSPLSLRNLPEMAMPEALAAMLILSSVIPIAYQVSPELFILGVLKQVDLSIQQGNTDLSAHAYACYGCILCSMAGDIELGFEFGQLSLSLLEKFNAKELKAKSLYVVSAIVTHWKRFIGSTLKPLLEAYTSALENGDLSHAAWAAYMYGYHSYFSGQELPGLAQQLAGYSKQLGQIRQESLMQMNDICRQTVLNLMGFGENFLELRGDAYDEQSMLSLHQENQNHTLMCKYYIQKLILCYLLNHKLAALEIAELAKQYLGAVVGYLDIPMFHFYDSLVHLLEFKNATKVDRDSWLERVIENQEKMEQWAYHAPMNYLHKFELVEAERYRVLECKVDAIELYDRAISGAKENGYIQEQALGNELAAKFYLDWGKEKVAAGYMQEAYYCYAKWGAKAKTDDLEKRYPQLLKPILEKQQIALNSSETIDFSTTLSSTSTYTSSSSTKISNILDFTSILKAAQTISSNIELDELITNLTKIILENSGAKKSVLILPQENNWQVRAITFINHQNDSQSKIKTILDSQLIDTCQDIPIKIINYVKNTQETVVIDNSQTEIPGIIGQYMLKYEPKSVLCTPILNQGHLVGILYLENKLASGVFTNERLQVIKLLSSQAAISLENAQLYQQAQQALEDLQQAQLKIVQSEKMSALGNLVAGVAHEMNNPLGFIYASLKQAKPTFSDIIEHLKLYQESLPNPDDEILEHAEEIDLDYSLEDLPKIFDSMVMACDRLKKISTSLRTFSRADRDYKVGFNIHQGIDSTILILKHRLKGNEQRPAIEVITDYADLPQIECFPGQLNQVFMNLLANAIDALEEFNTGRSFEEIKANPNQITIQTSIENNSVKIKITDNGKGISEETQNKIFEHLFTTKGVGKGTGLGLAIAKQIIEEKHGGQLSCNSIIGEGTEFVIEIPL